MKLVKYLALMAMAAVAAIAFTACDEQPQTQEEHKNPNLNHDLTLVVDIESVTSQSAKVKVTHNGSSTDTWLGFVTYKVDRSDRELIEEQIAAFKAGENTSSLHASKSYVQVLANLTPDTPYKYIAFGLSEEGEEYGNYGVLEFTTQSLGGNPGGGGNTGGGEIINGMRENSAWSVEYIGAGTLYEEEYDNIVKVTSVDNNPYMMTVVYASEWDPTQLRDLAELLVDSTVAYVEEFNSYYGTSYTLEDMLFVGDGYDAFNLYPGYYMALAIGVTPEGAVSGYYAVSDVFEVKEQVASAAFRAWLGNWDVVGNNDVTYRVNLSNGLANKYFYMSYWEGDMDFVVKVDYNADLDALFFYSQTIQEEVNFGDYGYGNLYFYGIDREGGLYTNEGGDYGIAIAGILDGGQRAIVRYEDDSVQGYPFFDFMQFIADIDGQYFRLTNAELLQMPAAMNPAGGQIAVSPKVSREPEALRTSLRKPERVFGAYPCAFGPVGL